MMGYEAMSRTPRWYYSAILPMIVLILGELCVRYSVIGEYRFVFYRIVIIISVWCRIR